MKRQAIVLLALAVAGLVVAASAIAGAQQSAKPAKAATVLIRHQMHGCHSWSVNGGSYAAVHTLALAKGGTVTFTNNDVMPQGLVKLAGAPVLFAGNKALNKPGAVVRVTFSKAGSYVFGTKPGEDYTKGVMTMGPDNVLRLVVTVS
jgi:plastocyanin